MRQNEWTNNGLKLKVETCFQVLMLNIMCPSTNTNIDRINLKDSVKDFPKYFIDAKK